VPAFTGSQPRMLLSNKGERAMKGKRTDGVGKFVEGYTAAYVRRSEIRQLASEHQRHVQAVDAHESNYANS
jgi:hypothetical protein